MKSAKYHPIDRDANKWRRTVYWTAANWEYCREPEYQDVFEPLTDPEYPFRWNVGYNMVDGLYRNLTDYVFYKHYRTVNYGEGVWYKVNSKYGKAFLKDVAAVRGNDDVI